MAASSADRAREAIPRTPLPGTVSKVRATYLMLDHFRRFLRSDKERMVDPYSGWTRDALTKAQARAKLSWLIHVAINRRAGIPESILAGRKYLPDYQAALRRDCRGVNDALHRRPRRRAWGLNGRRWETDEIQARYGHLIEPEEYRR